VKAYDAYVKESLLPFAKACDDLEKLGPIGAHLQDAWEGVRTVIVLASRSKQPKEDLAQALAPHLGPTQDAVKKIRDLKLDRDVRTICC